MGCSDDEIRVVRSPLRVSPLGAHVDHQDGLVTGMALDQAIYLAFVPRTDARVRVTSLNFEGCTDFTLDAIPPMAPAGLHHAGRRNCPGAVSRHPFGG